MLVRLRPMDTNIQAQICVGWVCSMPSAGVASLREKLVEDIKAATERVVQKWPLLAGKAVWLKQDGIFAIDVPDTLPDKLFTLTQSTIDVPYPVSDPLSSRRPGFEPLPDRAHYQGFVVPPTIDTLAKKGMPLLALHFTFFADAVALGITLPHQVLDGTGSGLVVKAINAELWGDTWEVPPMTEANPLAAAVGSLPPPTREEVPADYDKVFGRASIPGIVKALVRSAWEKYWWKTGEVDYLFIRRAVVERLAPEVKEAVRVQTQGKEYVSTSDVLTAWVFKTAEFVNSDSPATLEASGIFSVRKHLSTPTQNLESYPHNAVLPYPLFDPPVPFADFSSLSLADLALRHRRSLELYRSKPLVAALDRDVAPYPIMPRRELPLPWPLNQLVGKGPTHETSSRCLWNNLDCDFSRLSLPDPAVEGDAKDRPALPRLAFYFFSIMPFTPDHNDHLYQVDEGYMLRGALRPQVRKALEEAVQKLEDEFGGSE
ncbi:hypothetical protein JCM10207_007223 [Rhodosporidiobolus poonsookiae]